MSRRATWEGIPRRQMPELMDTLRQARRWADDVPAVTLFLASGASVRGEVLHHDMEVTVLADGDDLITVASPAVIGVRVHDAAQAVDVLTGGSVELRPNEQAPSRAHLRRDVAALESRWAKELPGSLYLSLEAPADTEARRLSLQRVLVDLADAVEMVGSPFVDAVDRIVISHADIPGAERVERDLWLSADLDSGRLGRWEDARALAKLLDEAVHS